LINLAATFHSFHVGTWSENPSRSRRNSIGFLNSIQMLALLMKIIQLTHHSLQHLPNGSE